jgi:putative drug exporter of the RND superfamily
MAVSMTLGPALMAIFGGLLFRPVPRWLRRQGVTRREGGGRVPARPRPEWTGRWNARTRVARFAAARPMALLIAAAGTAGLLAAAWGAHSIQLGSPLIRELPASSPAARAGTAAADGFAPGILSPTEILVIGPGVARQTAALARLQRELATQPGIAEIGGPATLPAQAAQVNPMLAASGDAARFVVVEKTDPLDATAISRVRQLQADLPALARAAGLPGARFELAGQTALTGDSIGSVLADLGRVALAIMAVTLVLLALFLRSLLAPVYLLAASVLAVFATLGLTSPTRSRSPRRKPRAPSPRPASRWRRVSPCSR